MKKLISLLTIITLLFTVIAVPSYAENNLMYSLEQAIMIAKEKLELDTDNMDFRSSFYDDSYDERNKWQLDWYSKGTSTNIGVTVDSDTGEILNYTYSNYSQKQPKFKQLPKYKKEEAQKYAEDFIIKLAGDKFNETKPYKNTYTNSSYYSDEYSFSYNRYVNGLEYQNNSIFVSINKNTLEVTRYYINWDKGLFPAQEEAISKEEAVKIFKDELGIEASYQSIYPKGSDKPVARLVYSLKNGNMPIDAITGKLISNSYRFAEDSTLEKGAEYSLAMSSKISVEEKNEIEKNKTYISKDKAITAISSYLSNIDDYVLANTNLNPGRNTENASWHLSWNKMNEETGRRLYMSGSVDAVTGEVLSFYKSRNEEYTKDQEVEYTEEQALNITKDFLEKISSEKYAVTVEKKQTINYSEDYEPPFYSFNFVKKVDGVYCPFNTLRVSVNKYNGEIESYNSYWLNIELPSAENIISLDEAYEKLFAKYDLLLKYVKHYTYTDITTSSQINLVYTLDNYIGFMDANTGEFVNYDGTPIKEETDSVFDDIENHEAKNDVELLVESGIIEVGTEYRPDNKILQRDFIMMLMKSIQPYSYYPAEESLKEDSDIYDAYYNQAISEKIISEIEKNPDGYVTKREAAKMLVNALGYGKIAQKYSIFNVSFDDAEEIFSQYKGYAVLAVELSILDLDDNNFNPREYLTRGNSATAIVNFLNPDITQ